MNTSNSERNATLTKSPGSGFPPEDREVVDLHEPIAREMAEPRDGHEPAPLWLVFAMMALLGWGGWYLGTYSGGFESAIYDERGGVPAAVARVSPEPVDPMVLGRRVYANCQACHQADGSGVPGNYPPLAASPWVAGDPVTLAHIVLHGVQGEWISKGATFNQAMPGWSHLSDDQIAAVLTYVRGSFGNDAGAVAPDLVLAAREASAGRRQPWTMAELRGAASGGSGRRDAPSGGE